MSPSEQTNQATRAKWRDLGFYYDFDPSQACWRFVGSQHGLRHFRDLLIAYTHNPQHQQLSEHEHYGPYFYLTVRTGNAPAIASDGIVGTLDDLRRLAHLVDEKLHTTLIGGLFTIDGEYASHNLAILQCEVQADAFDPASADPLL